jgi:RNA polymerase sigma-70 factor, ECF subfamily
MADLMSGPTRSAEGMSDEEIVARVLAGETALFELIMRRHNQRLYRTIRAILRDEAQAEDVVQDAYVRAYAHLDQFAGRASFSTWLIRIAVHEGMSRLRSGKRFEEEKGSAEREGDRMDRLASSLPSPEQQASASEIRILLEALIDRLPASAPSPSDARDVDSCGCALLDELETNSDVGVKVAPASRNIRKAAVVTSPHCSVWHHSTVKGVPNWPSQVGGCVDLHSALGTARKGVGVFSISRHSH